MRITIDNFDGAGVVDYSGSLDRTCSVEIGRKINAPSTLRCVLLGGTGFTVPSAGGRVVITKNDGSFLFTGYQTQAPSCGYLGQGERGAVYRYEVIAQSDEVLLDQRAVPDRAPFVARSAGSALRQLAADLEAFDTSAVQDLDVLASYKVNPQKKFSYHAGEIALAARASYRAMNGALMLAPVGAASYALHESDPTFCPTGLQLSQDNRIVNDVTVMGREEPQAYVRDYFVGDGLSQRFYLSQTPFQQSQRVLIDEEYATSALDAATWSVSDPVSAISVSGQTLQVNGGKGQDGTTWVSFVEQIEMGGGLKLQHGDVSFAGASRGVIGGLYAGEISSAGCVAGFQVTPNGTQSNLQALVNGSPEGPVVTTTAGHRYLMTTYVYSDEVFRSGQTYHSSAHPAGAGVGGAAVDADVRVVLEIQDINPSDPATMVAPAMVLYDGVIAGARGFCNYAPVNATNMQCNIAYTYVTHISVAEVRMALPNSDYVTELVGSLTDGGTCSIVSPTTLDFYPQYVPPLNTLIVASYRGVGRAVAEVANEGNIAKLANGTDDGVRGVVRMLKAPSARTQADCENAALAILDDATEAAWTGTYETWSDFLPGGAADIFPGDAIAVDVPSQGADFEAVVRRVGIEILDPHGDRGMYTIEFANDAAAPLAYEDAASTTPVPLQDRPCRLTTDQVGDSYLASLTDAQISEVTSTSAQVDTGMAPQSGWGIEVRTHDFGWGMANDRNLIGRFGAQTFTLPRFGRTQNYFLRLYDNSTPPRYSRYAAALHVDYPL